MHVSSTPRIRPHIDLTRHGFQPTRRTRVSTPIENRNAALSLEQDSRLQAELDRDAYHFASRPPPTACRR